GSTIINSRPSPTSKARTSRIRLTRCFEGPNYGQSTNPEEPKNQRTKMPIFGSRSEEHTSELQSRFDLVCRLLLEKKKKNIINKTLKKTNLQHSNQTTTHQQEYNTSANYITYSTK